MKIAFKISSMLYCIFILITIFGWMKHDTEMEIVTGIIILMMGVSALV